MRKQSLRVLYGICFAVALMVSTPAFAQGGTASISGHVTDANGLPLPGAAVAVSNAQTGASFNARTNDDGLYSVTNLPVGTYKVVINKEGFEKIVRNDVELHVADVAAINAQMTIGAVTDTITVGSGAPIINTTTSSLGGLVDDKQVQNLPLNGRNYIDLTLLQPGVTQNTNINTTGSSSGSWFSSNGAPLRSNAYTLDGAILQNINAGSTASLSGVALGLDGIQEYRVITNNPSAEYGLSMGSQTVIVSRGGTNALHGSIFEYLRNSAMDAANNFDKPLAANNFHRLPPFRRNNFGGALGGPIRKDKTFFFLTYEGLRERLGITNSTNVMGAGCHGAAGATITGGTAAGQCPQLTAGSTAIISATTAPLLALYPLPNVVNASTGVYQYNFPYSQPNTDDYGQARIDHAISQRDLLFVRYTGEYNNQVPTTAYQQFINPRLSGSDYATIAETHTLKNTMLNSARFSYSHTASTRTSPTDLAGAQTSLYTGLPVPNISIGGIATFGPQQSAAVPSIQNQDIYTLEDDFLMTKGRHSLKMGTMINRFRWFLQNPNRLGGTVNFASVSTFLTDAPSTYAITTPGSNLQRTYQFYTLGFYIQDDWHVTNNLIVNAGLRYEPSTQINEVHGFGSAFIHPASDANYTVGVPYANPTKNNFSPRLGFAWDVFGNSRTAIRGGAAILYDIANLGNAMINMSPVQPPFSSGTTYTPTVACPFTIPINPCASSGGVVGKSSDVTMQYNLKQPKMFTENLGVQQQLPFRSSISIAYAGSRGMYLMTEEEGNPNIPNGFANGQVSFPTTGAVRLNGTGAGSTGNGWGNIGVWSSTADSIYHSLQIALIKQQTHGLQFQGSYTWSKLIDNGEGLGQGDTTEVSIFNADPYNQRYDRGPAYFDLTNNWVFNALYNIPGLKSSSSFVHGLTNGWSVSGIDKAHGGLPFHPVLATSRSNSGVFTGANVDRPNWTPGFSGPVILHTAAHWFDTNAFVLQPAGTLGNVGRDSLRGPGFLDTDLSVQKATQLHLLGGAGTLNLRLDAFNIANHPNLAMPSPTPFTTASGQITSTVSPSRQLQVSARIAF